MNTSYYERLFLDFSKELNSFPNGRIATKRNGRIRSFYQVIDTDNGPYWKSRGGAKNLELRNSLRRKEAIIMACNSLQNLINLHNQSKPYESALDPQEITNKIAAIAPTEGWCFDGVPHVGNYTYQGYSETEASPPYPESLKINTHLGFFVRSKTELLIVRELYKRGIEFKYEQPLKIGGRIVFPDFTFKKRNGELIIWEHLGLSDKQYYVNSSMEKLGLYISSGFRFNSTLFVTNENDLNPLDQKTIDTIIDQIASML